MKVRKKRKQREEVRKILHTIRLELAAQSAANTYHGTKKPILSISEILKNYQRGSSS